MNVFSKRPAAPLTWSARAPYLAAGYEIAPATPGQDQPQGAWSMHRANTLTEFPSLTDGSIAVIAGMRPNRGWGADEAARTWLSFVEVNVSKTNDGLRVADTIDKYLVNRLHGSGAAPKRESADTHSFLRVYKLIDADQPHPTYETGNNHRLSDSANAKFRNHVDLSARFRSMAACFIAEGVNEYGTPYTWNVPLHTVPIAELPEMTPKEASELTQEINELLSRSCR